MLRPHHASKVDKSTFRVCFKTLWRYHGTWSSPGHSHVVTLKKDDGSYPIISQQCNLQLFKCKLKLLSIPHMNWKHIKVYIFHEASKKNVIGINFDYLQVQSLLSRAWIEDLADSWFCSISHKPHLRWLDMLSRV